MGKREFGERDIWYFFVFYGYIVIVGFVYLTISFYGKRLGF